MSIQLTGPIYSTCIRDGRSTMVICVPFREIRDYLKVEPFDHTTGQGVQRGEVSRQIATLRDAYVNNTFTPTPLTVSLPVQFKHYLTVKKREGVKFGILNLDKSSYLLIIDGLQRTSAIQRLIDSGEEWANDIQFIINVMLEGDPQDDFLNLQRGLSVTQNVQIGLEAVKTKGSPLNLAYQVAEVLDSETASPFYDKIVFDACRKGCLPVSSLLQKNTSFLSYSLLGTVRIALEFDVQEPEWIANFIIESFTKIKKKQPTLFDFGKIFSFPPKGRKGSAAMFLSCCNVLMYQSLYGGFESPLNSGLDSTIKFVMEFSGHDKPVAQNIKLNYSSPEIRRFAGKLAKEVFSREKLEKKYDDVPAGLVRLFTVSAFSLKPMKKREWILFKAKV